MRDYAELVKGLRDCSRRNARVCMICGAKASNLCEGTKSKRMFYAADAIEELLTAVPHWNSVEERLPEFGERVLVSNGGFVCESFLSQSGKWQRGGVDMFFMTPTHWMPLPKAPKEVE